MSTVSIHPIEYLKVHLPLEGVRLITHTTSLAKKIFDLAETGAKVATVVLVGGLIVLALSTIVESSAMTAIYCDAITKVVALP